MEEIAFALEPVTSIDEVGRLWRRLEQRSPVSFFVSWTWIGAWLRCLPEHIRPQLLTASVGPESIAAAILVPARERRHGLFNVRQLHFNTTGDPALDSIWIEHNGFVASVETGPTLWPAFFAWLSRLADVDELFVPRTVDGSIEGTARNTGLLGTVNDTQGFRTPLRPGGVEAALAQLSANTRQQLRRSLRAAGELRCEGADSIETAISWFDKLKAFHITSWEARGRPHAFRHAFAEAFHKNLITRGVPEGFVKILRITAGTSILGYLYNFQRAGIVYAYQSGFDYRRADLRPGYISHLLAMALSADEGANCYDFLVGDNQLKRSLGVTIYRMYSHRVGNPRLDLRLESGLRSLRNRLRW